MKFPYSRVGNKKKQRQPLNGSPPKGRKPSLPKKKRSLRHFLAGFAIFAWLTAFTLGIFTLIGSVSSSMNNLCVAEIHTNQTYTVDFRVGYYGGCLSMTNNTGGAAISSNTSDGTHTQCVINMHFKDDDDLTDQLTDDWTVTAEAKAALTSSLNETIWWARHLQGDVFPAAAPTVHVALFFISGIMLFVASTAQSPRRPYKFVLVLAVLIGAFALAMVFLSVVGSQQSLNALVDGDGDEESKEIRGGVFVQRVGFLWYVQVAQVTFVSMFYVFIGMMFV